MPRLHHSSPHHHCYLVQRSLWTQILLLLRLPRRSLSLYGVKKKKGYYCVVILRQYDKKTKHSIWWGEPFVPNANPSVVLAKSAKEPPTDSKPKPEESVKENYHLVCNWRFFFLIHHICLHDSSVQQLGHNINNRFALNFDIWNFASVKFDSIWFCSWYEIIWRLFNMTSASCLCTHKCNQSIIWTVK